jgi:hypothetical protein
MLKKGKSLKKHLEVLIQYLKKVIVLNNGAKIIALLYEKASISD